MMASDAADTTAGEARLRRVLETLGSVYGDEAVDIEFSDELRVEENNTWRSNTASHKFVLPARAGEYLDADLTRDAEYELLLDTLNHLTYCRRVDSWDRTESFGSAATRPEPLAAFVHRMVEHAHVTTARLSEFRGLTGAYARRMEATFDEEPRVDRLRQDAALLEGLRELAYTGQVAGLDDAPETVRGTLAYAATELDRVRDPRADAELRDEVAERVLRTLSNRMYRPQTAERHLRNDLDLPFQDTLTLLPDVEDDANATDDSDESDILEWVLVLPMFPPMFALQLLGYEDALESFYTPLPEGPYRLLLLLYPLLLPVFVVWGVVRAVASRTGYWDAIAGAGSRCWVRAQRSVAWLRDGSRTLSDRLRAGIASGGVRIAEAVNNRLPGDRGSVVTAYVVPFALPYELVELLLGEEPVADFLDPITDRNPSNRVIAALYMLVLPPLAGLLFPVFLLWLLVRGIALAVGLWDRLTATVSRLARGVAAAPRRVAGAIRLVPALLVGALTLLAARIREWWNRTAYATRRGLRRARGDDWRRNLPDDLDEDRLADRAGPDTDADREFRDGDQKPVDGDEGPSNTGPDVATGDDEAGDGATRSEPEAVGASGHDDAEAGSLDESEADETTERLLADADRRSTSSRGEVTVVEVEYEDADGTVIDEALGDLSALDRRTKSELQSLRADRDERIGSGGDPGAVFDAMHERGLDETIRELLAQFPPEERRKVRGETGQRLDLQAVARSAGGRLPNEGVFTRRQHTDTGSRCIGVATDLSGSMDQFEAKVALAALASAADLLRDEFLAVSFPGSDRPASLLTGPNEPFDPDHLSAVETGGGTPLAAGIQEGRRLLKAADADELVLLVVTDGRPRDGLPDGESPEADTRSQIEHCRRDGITVVGVGVDSGSKMNSLFGEDAHVEVEDEAFADRLLDVYREQLLRTQLR